MKIKLSSKGQVVLPVAARDKYQLKAGDTLRLVLKEDQMTLVPEKKRKFKTWVETSPVTGLPVIVSEAGAPKITSAWVAKMMEEFP